MEPARRSSCGGCRSSRSGTPYPSRLLTRLHGQLRPILLARVESLGEAIRELQTRGVRVVAADQDAPHTAWESNLQGPIAIVVGSEGSGVSGATRRRCDLLVSFPMAGSIASLNAATAGALLLFEVVRQRLASGRG